MSQIKEVLSNHPTIYRVLSPLLWLRRRVLFSNKVKLKHALRLLHCNIVGGRVVLTVDGFPGSYEVDIRTDLCQRILLQKSYEPKLVSSIGKMIDVNNDIIDIGSNIGLFSVLCASQILPGRRVLAIEPSPSAREILYNNLKRNGVDNRVIIFPGAASNSVDTCLFYNVNGKEEYSSIRPICPEYFPNTHIEEIRVPTSTVDELVNKYSLSPGLMKIDTEGAELFVISGATRVLAKYRPVIFSELSDSMLAPLGHNSQEVIEILVKLEYQVLDLQTSLPIKQRQYEGNVIAIPNEQGMLFEKLYK